MDQNEPKQVQVEAPEPIRVIVKNHTACEIVARDGKSYRNDDGLLIIEVHVCAPGQHLRLVEDHNENIAVQDEDMIPRPGA